MADKVGYLKLDSSEDDDSGDETEVKQTGHTEHLKQKETIQSQQEGRKIQEKAKLTILKKSKIQKEFKAPTTIKETSKLAVVCKWFSSLVIGLVVLFCAVLSTISILALSDRMNHAAKEVDTNYVAETFVMLQILIIVPHIINIIRSLWSVWFRKDSGFPPWNILIVGAFVGVFESAGICLFVFNFPGMMKIHDALILMNCVFLLPLGNYFINFLATCCLKDHKEGTPKEETEEQQKQRIHKCLWPSAILAAFLSGVALIVIMYYILKYEEGMSNTEHLGMVIISLGFLSVSWMPCVNSYLLGEECLPCVNRCLFGKKSQPPIEKSQEQSKQSKDPANTEYSPWKLTIYLSSVKIVFTCVFSMVIFLVPVSSTFRNAMNETEFNWNAYEKGWKWTDITNDEIYYFAVNISTSFVGYWIGYLAWTTRTHIAGFSFLLLLGTPASILFIYLTDVCNSIVFRFEYTDCETTRVRSALIPIAAALPIVIAIPMVYLHVTSKILVKQKEEKLFWLPVYNSAMLDQWLLLNRKIGYPTDAKDYTETQNYKVYICTTMFREDRKEMEQLLESIKGVNEAFGGEKYEAHVFFDGGVRNGNLSEHVVQLISLVKTTLGLTAKQAIKETTPYGMALSWRMKDTGKQQPGLAFKIHLKDNKKVKNKKRWSQVMYMSYVLDYILERRKGTSDQTETTPGTSNQTKTNPGTSDQIETTPENSDQTDTTPGTSDQTDTTPGTSDQTDTTPGTSDQTDTTPGTSDQTDTTPGTSDQTDTTPGTSYQTETTPGIENAYILTTDADVRFTPSSVEALIDLMKRDKNVGAVCARTHPLGSGLVVWYQVFEYAIGHWFQKAAEDELGSVLCSPGCFSLYRCEAVADVLPDYATEVEHAFDFLTKDMGEDRWFCTLMVQSGWQIEYCATSENHTHCPTEFDEFFKQRRRWIVSTLANMVLLLKEWKLVRRMNPRISIMFLVYQAILLYATLTGPSSVILVISGGLAYGWNWDVPTTLTLQILIYISFTLICLFTSQKTQLIVAKVLTILFAILMTPVVIGTVLQIVSDFSTDKTIEHNFINQNIRISTMTFYMVLIVGIFVLTGILHLSEVFYLIHGLWYILCLASGYLILMIYSICNITDSSWGTREETKKTKAKEKTDWLDQLLVFFKRVCCCCRIKQTDDTIVTPGPATETDLTDNTDRFPIGNGHMNNSSERLAMPEEDIIDSSTTSSSTEGRCYKVYDWLRTFGAERYAREFEENGYENKTFIAGMSEDELKKIGIDCESHRRKLLEEIDNLPDFDFKSQIPDNVSAWLKTIGLHQYRRQFREKFIDSVKTLAALKFFTDEKFETELNITKTGHIKRLKLAIESLRECTESELKEQLIKSEIRGCPESKLNDKEKLFWTQLREFRLMPRSAAFLREGNLKRGLIDLRNTWLLGFAVTNCIWIILIYTLADKGEVFRVFGSNPIGLVALLVFGFVVLVQFVAMLFHRLSTLKHFLARAPYTTRTTRKDAKSSADEKTPDDDKKNTKAGKGTQNRPRSESQEQLIRSKASINCDAGSPIDLYERPNTQHTVEIHEMEDSNKWDKGSKDTWERTRILPGGDNPSSYGTTDA